MWTTKRLKPKDWKGKRVAHKQYKYNGHRFTIWKQEDGTLVGFEREIRLDLEMTVKRPHIVEYDWWKALKEIPPMSCVDGELYIPFGNAGDAAHAIAEGLNTLDFMPFAVPVWAGAHITSYSLLYAAEKLKRKTSLQFAPFFKLMEHDTEELLIDDAKTLGIEGWVLKNANYEDWWKVKPTYPIDMVVTKLKWSDSDRYIGTIASLHASVYINDKLTEISCVPGSSIPDNIRWEISDKDIGRVLEAEYQEVGNGRRLIHPKFTRWRDDKPADQCRYRLIGNKYTGTVTKI